MGLEEIIAQVNKEADSKAKEILEQAQADALKIIDNAKEEASQFLKEQKGVTDKDAERFVLRETSKAETEAKSVYRAAVGETLDYSFLLLSTELKAFTLTDDYTNLLKKLVGIAVSYLGSGCVINARKEDIKRIGSQPSATIKELKEKTAGGIKCVSEDGKKSVDFTLESIVEMLRDKISAAVLEYSDSGV
jgi:vacuolar-type H+-ATPase subunit E/Vma4